MAPHTMEIAALWAVLTRLEDPTHPNLSLLQKAKLYDGEEVQGFTVENVREMREAAEREGMFGISPRYVQDRIANRAGLARQGGVGPLDVLMRHRGGPPAPQPDLQRGDPAKRYVQLLATARGGVRGDHQARGAGGRRRRR